jgi:retron-type reverse transcriptase
VSVTCKISKRAVFEAWLRVKKSGGGAGIDGVTLSMFEDSLQDNLYKIWVRMASGSYFPPRVKGVC